ncbi:chemotaxis protein CheA [Clostridium sp. C8-1-8]|uniref:chemotaxis protein CheA n=1 Tax=Clostridium sp. C8-1-8 TaxID=2698831 RepID=UPI001371C296|nr:chemotaxis protein CheA [Clostridium sp. C8-1-8]
MSGIFESSEMIGAFLDEIEEQLQFLEQGILELEQEKENPEVIQKIFRVAHTLKGSSATMGYDKMKNLTHEMENVFDRIRNNLLIADKAIVNVLFKCLDVLRFLRDDFVESKNNTKIDISEVLEDLKLILEGKDKEVNQVQVEKQEAVDALSTSKEDTFDLDDEQLSILKNSSLSGLNNLVCSVKISENSFMKATRACLIINSLNDMGTVVTSSPNVLDIPLDADISVVNYLMTTYLSIEELKEKASQELMDVEEVEVTEYSNESTFEEEKSSSEKEDIDDTEVVKAGKKLDEVTEKAHLEENKKKETEKRTSQTVRVDIERLEQMMNLVGEMVIEQTRISQVGSILHGRYSQDETVEDLIGISNHVSRVVSELQESIMKARMLPVQQLFNRLPRLVRDLSQTLNKEIDLVLEGGETEMDRTIIEDITDPLIHIVRNSLDHGIEKSELREANGKPSKGTIKIKAFHQENHVIITIEDDGAGLDLEKIKNSAVKKKVLSKQEADNLSKSEIINLIFETGLSTAESVSDVSGRGVGMDIVRNHIDKLNGIIDVDTNPGEGTKFTIKLPLTLAILTGLLVKIHDETYAIPMSNIVEIVRKPIDEIESVKKQSIVVIRDKVHPLIWLHDYFKLPRGEKKKNVFIVVLGTAEKRFGIVVDKLVGNQEIVIKPLGSYVGKVEGVSGATILGDGSVACIFDVVGMSKMVSNKVKRESITLASEDSDTDKLK